MSVIHGDCLAVMPTLDADSVDAIVCDPPYGLAFMGKAWDHGVPGPEFWEAALRVVKPGAWMVAAGGTRTYHRLTCAIEDAGWEIRDSLCWLFGSGFPKSYNLPGGLGTALKPAHEPICLARKPLTGTVAANVAAHGTGALNIDGCRIAGPTDPAKWGGTQYSESPTFKKIGGDGEYATEQHALGRWPANVVLDEEAARLLDAQSGELHNQNPATRAHGGAGKFANQGAGEGWRTQRGPEGWYDDKGGASRFFFNARMSHEELFLHRAKAIFEAWNPAFASTADSRLSLSSQHAASALSDAVTLASHGATHLSDLRELSTSVTVSELRMLCEAVIALTLSFASASSLESPHTRPTPSGNHVNGAGNHGPTGTTTITADLSTFGGSAVVATLSAIATSSAPGGPASPSRAFYTAKASRAEREAGLETMPLGAMYDRDPSKTSHRLQVFSEDGRPEESTKARNHHPTVKPLSLMRWLCRLVTPPGGVILDPFAGSGSTGCAAVLEGFRFIGIEREADYVEIARRRIAHTESNIEPDLFGGVA